MDALELDKEQEVKFRRFFPKSFKDQTGFWTNESYRILSDMFFESTTLMEFKEFLMMKDNSMALRRLVFTYSLPNNKVVRFHVVDFEIADSSEQTPSLFQADQYLIRYRMTELQIAKPVDRYNR